MVFQKRAFIISALVFAGMLLFFGLFIPAAVCTDGWASPSIGSQGACSSHGGVQTYSAWVLLIFVVSCYASAKLYKHLLNLRPDFFLGFIPPSENITLRWLQSGITATLKAIYNMLLHIAIAIVRAAKKKNER